MDKNKANAWLEKNTSQIDKYSENHEDNQRIIHDMNMILDIVQDLVIRIDKLEEICGLKKPPQDRRDNR